MSKRTGLSLTRAELLEHEESFQFAEKLALIDDYENDNDNKKVIMVDTEAKQGELF